MFPAIPVSLEGHGVRLEPLSDGHHDALNAAAADGRLWERWFTAIPPADRVEIGYTWYAARMQRSHVNTACKLLLFEFAFEKVKCRVVGLRTDNFNFRSQRAIEALGAKQDGVIRHHWPRRDGTIRDTVMYSVLAHEWPDVRRHLEFRLQRNASH